MIAKHLKSDKRILSLLEQCLSMKQIKQIHGNLIAAGDFSDNFPAGKIIAFCAISDHGDLNYADLVFRQISHPNTYIWNTMIRAFAERKQPIRALSLYSEMLRNDHLPNNYTFSFLLRACLDLSAVSDGMKFHAQICKLGWESYDFVQNGLIHLYANYECIDHARQLFDKSPTRDVISWTAMVSGYAKSGQLELARQLFDEMPERNVVSWSAMIASYAQSSMFKEALDLFNEMQLAGFVPNHGAIVSALSACSFLGALDQGKWIHVYVDKNRMELDRILGTAVVDMYAKCGCIETARQVFDKMPERDVFAWTSMISGLASHGHSERAIELFEEMQKNKVRPNSITFICVLSACSRVGLVEEGKRFFESMSKVYGIEPGIEHYGCLVDLLGRAGFLRDAAKVVREMPLEPDAYALGALLGACRMHGDVELGEEMAKNLAKSRLDHGGVHVLLSNMYAAACRWEDVAKVRKVMEEKKVRKTPGCSLIEMDGVVCEFVAGDNSHSMMGEIKSLLQGIDMQLKSLWVC